MSRKPSSSYRPSEPKTVSRNSAIPRLTPQPRQVTHEMIAKRAYEIFISGKGGNQTENWLRAERELKSGR